MSHPIGAVLSLITVTALAPIAPFQPAPKGPSPLCAIDMGSNTFRRIVGSFEDRKYVQQPVEKKAMGIGDEVERSGRISDKTLTEIGAVLAAFKASCVKEGVTRISAIGTAAFRDAANGADVIAIAKKAGVPMEIATERRESELAYLVGSLGRYGDAVIDHGSRSIELVAKDGAAPQYSVFSLGYRVAYEKFFANATDPATAVEQYREGLRREVEKAGFMKGKTRLIGLEYGDMIEVLFEGGAVERRVLTLEQLRQRLDRITSSGPSGFKALKQTKDIDRALPRLVSAAFLTEAFGYSRLELTERELGSGLIIEAGLK